MGSTCVTRAQAHSLPVGTPVRCHIGDVRVVGPTLGVGRVVEHTWRHGVIPMYWVELRKPVELVTGAYTTRLLLWEEQLRPHVAAACYSSNEV